MSGFEFSSPRIALASIAAVAAALTLSVLVVVPAQLETARADWPLLSSANAAPAMQARAEPGAQRE